MGMHLPCTKCGQPAGAPCVNLRTGQPIKREHPDGRVLTVQVLTPQDLLTQLETRTTCG